MKARLLWFIGAIGLPVLAGGIALYVFGGGSVEGRGNVDDFAVWAIDGVMGMATSTPIIIATSTPISNQRGIAVADMFDGETGAFNSVFVDSNDWRDASCRWWIGDDGQRIDAGDYHDFYYFWRASSHEVDGGMEYVCLPNPEDIAYDYLALDVRTDVDCGQRLALRWRWGGRALDRETQCYVQYEPRDFLWRDWIDYPAGLELNDGFPAGSYSVLFSNADNSWGSYGKTKYVHKGDPFWIVEKGQIGWDRDLVGDDADMLAELAKWDEVAFEIRWYMDWERVDDGSPFYRTIGTLEIGDGIANAAADKARCIAGKATPTPTSTLVPMMPRGEHERIVRDIQATATAVSAQMAILTSERDVARSKLADSGIERERLSAALSAAEAAKARMRDVRDAAVAAKEAAVETLRRRSEAYQARIDQLREANWRLQERVNDLRARLRGR